MALVCRAKTDVVQLHAQRVLWRGMVEMLEAQEAIPNRHLIRNMLTQWYLSHQLSGIRRHSDLRRRTASLARIWESIRKNNHVLTKERYAEVYSIDDLTKSMSREYFDTHYGGGGDCVDPNLAQGHVDRLTIGTREIRNHVNASIAHLSANPESGEPVQFGDINDALTILEGELQSLYLLLYGSSLLQAEPVFQQAWRTAFYVPWAPEDEIQTWVEAQEWAHGG